MNNSDFECRLHEREYPEVGDFVMVRVDTIEKPLIYGTLIEYLKTCMIILPPVVKRQHAVLKQLRVGKTDIFKVKAVDSIRGYIDVIKIPIDKEQARNVTDTWLKSRGVYDIMSALSSKIDMPIPDLYHDLVWPLNQTYGNAYVALRSIDQIGELPIEMARPFLIDIIAEKYPPELATLKSEFEITCYGEMGIDAIKDVLMNTKWAHPEIDIVYITSPRYVISYKTNDTESGIALLKSICDDIEKSIMAYDGGNFKMINAPSIGDVDLKTMIARVSSELEPAPNEPTEEHDDMDDEVARYIKDKINSASY